MPAGGDQIVAVSLTPTGITISDGTPVRVVIGGAITRQPTPGLQFFCSTDEWRDACATRWADLVSDQPIPPAGIYGFYARAFASWAGAPPGNLEGSVELSLTGPAQGQLYAGCGGWQCDYELNVRNPDGTMKYPYELGPCHTFGGGYIVAVQSDDGGGTLVLAASKTQLPAAGGTVSFHLSATVTVNNTVVKSDAVTVRQNEFDTLRQEYEDFGVDQPAGAAARTDMNVGSISWSQLNQGDYTIAFVEDRLIGELAPIQALTPFTITLSSRLETGEPMRPRVASTGIVRSTSWAHSEGVRS